MVTAKGSVSVNVWVDCPHCAETFDAMDIDDDDASLAEVVTDGKSKVWSDMSYGLNCPHCHGDILITQLEW